MHHKMAYMYKASTEHNILLMKMEAILYPVLYSPSSVRNNSATSRGW